MLSRNFSLSNMFVKVFTSQLLNSMDLMTVPVHVFIIFWASKPWWYFHHCCISDDWETWERINQNLISWRHSLEARGGSWDSFGLFLVLARDLWHCASAQLTCSLFVLFFIVSFPMVMFLRVQIGMTLFPYIAYVFAFFDLLSLKLVSLE